ncbi:MAG: ABC transporter substrate-binding protein [Alistipes sp.]
MDDFFLLLSPMNRFFQLTLLCLLLSATSCGSQHGAALNDFNIPTYTPEYASGFEIHGTKRGKSTLICVHNPWQGAQDVEQQLLLLREDEAIPEGYTGQVVRTPVKRVICMSSSHVAMFDILKQPRRIVGVSGMEYISSDYINAHKFCGEVRDVGYDTNLNFELIVSLQPDIILLYGVSGDNTAVTGKLAELGIPYMYLGDYLEESPLGKAEWLITIAEMIDLREFGQEIFTGICERYNTLKNSISFVADRPKVMLNTPYRDSWFMPSDRSYMVQLITDAGGSYLYTENHSNSSVPITLEEAYLLTHQADFWLNVGQHNTLEGLMAQNPRFSKIPAVTGQRVYNNNRRQTTSGGSDFWESGVVHPDLILQDLITIFHANLSATDQLYYYKQLE